jgi:hypothetical protein
MTLQIENAGVAGAIRVASADSAPPALSSTRVPPRSPTPNSVPTTQRISETVTVS